jgi:insertion element IS1 protein InsB
VAFYQVEKNKLWIIKAVDRRTGRTIAWVTGNRDAKTFKRLFDKFKHLTNCKFYTDNWDAFSKVIPIERHVIGKAHTITIEQDNSCTRHDMGRFTRKSKVVSQCELMVNLTLRLWHAVTVGGLFGVLQNVFLSIFI